MSLFIKKIIAIIIITGTIVLLYFGAYLPLRKGQAYISALKNMSANKPKSLEDLNNIFKPALEFYSPVGKYEEVSAYLGAMLGIINQQNNKAVVGALVEQIEENALPVLSEEKKSFNYWQSIYTLGLIYRTAALKFNDEIYYQKALQTFKEGLKYSPNRPALLYGLFDLYIAANDKEKAKEVGQIILQNWAEDQEVKKVVETK